MTPTHNQPPWPNQPGGWQQPPVPQPSWDQTQLSSPQPAWDQSQPGLPQPDWNQGPDQRGWAPQQPQKPSRTPIVIAIALVLAAVIAVGVIWFVTSRDSGDYEDSAADPAAPQLASLNGSWTGRYHCGQGDTALTLRFSDGTAESTTAVFTFSALESNPEVPDGSFELSGALVDGKLVLTPTRWINTASGYVMVGLTVSEPITAGQSTLSGSVDDPSCTTFAVTRSTGD